MNPIAYLEQTRDALQALCDELTAELASAPAATGKWNAEQHLEHLATAERGMLLGLRRQAGQTATEEELAATAGKTELILTRIARTVRAVEAPAIVQPVGRYGVWPGARQAFFEAREATLQFARTSPAESLAATVMPHPILGPLTAEQWLLFAAAHSARHLEHIRSVLDSRKTDSHEKNFAAS